jgi:hypothetical protein
VPVDSVPADSVYDDSVYGGQKPCSLARPQLPAGRQVFPAVWSVPHGVRGGGDSTTERGKAASAVCQETVVDISVGPGVGWHHRRM